MLSLWWRVLWEDKNLGLKGGASGKTDNEGSSPGHDELTSHGTCAFSMRIQFSVPTPKPQMGYISEVLFIIARHYVLRSAADSKPIFAGPQRPDLLHKRNIYQN